MKLSRFTWKKIILLLFLSNYLAVSALVSLGHDHDADFDFHEQCPACQWQVQSQEDFSDILSVITALLDPLIVVDENPEVCVLVLPQKDAVSIYFSRAPPAV
jgi:hypothetical protein